jgi:hypothetical protein
MTEHKVTASNFYSSVVMHSFSHRLDNSKAPWVQHALQGDISVLAEVELMHTVYFAYSPSVMMNDIVFWGSSSKSNKVSFLQKRIVRIMAGAQTSKSYRDLY